MRNRVIVAAVAALFGLGLTVNTADAAEPHPGITCIAHRGGQSTHTEETAFTYDAAIAAEVPEIEGDVRFTKTGFPYLLHSANLALFGHPTVNLSKISGGTATGPTYVSATGDKLLSLFQLRQKLVASPSTKVQLELKTTLTEANWVMLADRLNPIRSRVTLTSFSKATVQAAQVHGYRTGLLSTAFSTTTEAPTFIVNFANLNAVGTLQHKLVGVATQTFTIDTVDQWDDAATAGVTGIITNNPVECLEWVAGL